jgi:hypothetical protein
MIVLPRVDGDMIAIAARRCRQAWRERPLKLDEEMELVLNWCRGYYQGWLDGGSDMTEQEIARVIERLGWYARVP